MATSGLKISRPTYAQERRENTQINNYLGSVTTSNYGIFNQPHIEIKSKYNEIYKPERDQKRLSEMREIEKRYKMNFEQKKKGYFKTEYLVKLTDLLNRKPKDYITRRKKLISKYQPIYSKDFLSKVHLNAQREKKKESSLSTIFNNTICATKPNIQKKKIFLISPHREETNFCKTYCTEDNLQLFDTDEAQTLPKLDKVVSDLKLRYKFFREDFAKKTKVIEANSERKNNLKIFCPSQKEFFQTLRFRTSKK